VFAGDDIAHVLFISLSLCISNRNSAWWFDFLVSQTAASVPDGKVFEVGLELERPGSCREVDTGPRSSSLVRGGSHSGDPSGSSWQVADACSCCKWLPCDARRCPQPLSMRATWGPDQPRCPRNRCKLKRRTNLGSRPMASPPFNAGVKRALSRQQTLVCSIFAKFWSPSSQPASCGQNTNSLPK